jgi:hypothetical protein
LLKDLLRCRELADFQRKVDEKTAGYYETIKRPMDLRTLQERLGSGQVTTVAEFKEELDLIWENCIVFNGPQHHLSLIAFEVRRTIDRVWEESVEPSASHGLEKLKELDGYLDKLYKLGKKLIKIDDRPSIPPAKKPPKFSPKPPAPEVIPPVKVVDLVPNHQQRKIIADKLTNLGVAEMRKAWDLLKPFLNETTLERQFLSLNDLPEGALVELKKIVLT